MTVTGTTVAGYLTVWPCGTPQPNASNLNFTSGQTIANLVIAKIGANGNVCISVTQASAHIIADVEGQYGTNAPVIALPPARLLDTRPGGTAIDNVSQGGGIVQPGGMIALPVINRGGSGTNVGVVGLNVTVTGATGVGYLTVWPCGTPRPNASSLNYETGQTIANLVITKPGPDGTVCFSPDGASTHILADIAAAGPPGTINAITPARLLDTRPGGTTIDHLNQGTGPLAGGATLELPITGRAATGPEATTTVLNVTITDPATDGYLTVWPCGQPQPNASNINFVHGQTIPNNITTKIGTNDRVCLSSTATTHIIADLTATA